MNEIEIQFEEWLESEVEETDINKDLLLRAFTAGRNLAEENFHYGEDQPNNF